MVYFHSKLKSVLISISMHCIPTFKTLNIHKKTLLAYRCLEHGGKNAVPSPIPNEPLNAIAVIEIRKNRKKRRWYNISIISPHPYE